MSLQTSRRDFLKASTIAGVGFMVGAGNSVQIARASALQGIALAGIGVGGKGSSDIDQAALYGKVVALCDTDRNTLAGKAKTYPDAKTYTDYRELYAEMMDKIDAVTVSTPDHMHTIITAEALKAGKHAYTQKPLTRTIGEARYLGYLAKKYGVCTQMGNQGSSLRRAGSSRRYRRNQEGSHLDQPSGLGSGPQSRYDDGKVHRPDEEGRRRRRIGRRFDQ